MLTFIRYFSDELYKVCKAPAGIAVIEIKEMHQPNVMAPVEYL